TPLLTFSELTWVSAAMLTFGMLTETLSVLLQALGCGLVWYAVYADTMPLLLSTFAQSVPLKIAQSPPCQSLAACGMVNDSVLPASTLISMTPSVRVRPAKFMRELCVQPMT